MAGPSLLVKRLSPLVSMPRYAHAGDAGIDLCCAEAFDLAPRQRKLIGTGLVIELPPGTEAQVRPRSGLALEYGVTVLNAPGTIDAGFRGELKVLLINHGDRMFHADAGTRIAQLVIARVLRVEIEEADALSATARDAGGFGSTGR